MIALCNLREFQADALINPYERCSKELRPYGIKLNHKIEVQGEGSRQSNYIEILISEICAKVCIV